MCSPFTITMALHRAREWQAWKTTDSVTFGTNLAGQSHRTDLKNSECFHWVALCIFHCSQCNSRFNVWWFLKPMLHVYSSSSISGVSTYLETTLQTTPSWFATLRSSRSEELQASSWSRTRSSPDRLSSSRSSRCACPSWRKIRQRRTCLQVICEMPALDIHSNEERHRFDLRDNTDQTRMFIKVKIAPTGSFSR